MFGRLVSLSKASWLDRQRSLPVITHPNGLRKSTLKPTQAPSPNHKGQHGVVSRRNKLEALRASGLR